MKARIFLLFVAGALVALGLWSIARRGGHHATTAAPQRRKGPSVPEVPVQDGKTLDFSDGKAVVKDTPADREALQKSVDEMAAAAGSVTFSPATVPAGTHPATSATGERK